MTVLHHALCGDDFDQTPVSITFRKKCSKFFGFVGDATQVLGAARRPRGKGEHETRGGRALR